MSTEQLNAILHAGAENQPPINGSAIELRNWFEEAYSGIPVDKEAYIEPVTLGPIGGELTQYPNDDKSKLIIFFHGGGFIFGSPRTHRGISTNLARVTGVPVLSVDYRLAPEYPAPTAHNDAFAVYNWALAEGFDPQNIALGGDSAGGNLALSAVITARDEELPLPCCLFLMSPALDLASDGESHHTQANAPLLNAELMARFNELYIGEGDRRSSAVTPLYSDKSQLPSVLIHVGTDEILIDDSKTLHSQLREAGVSSELKIWPDMCHSWQMFAPYLDEGMDSVEEAGHFIKSLFDRK